MLKAELPAEGIIKLTEFDDLKGYRIECLCTDADHHAEMYVIYDEEMRDVTVNFGQAHVTHNLWGRLKEAAHVLYYGYHKQCSEILLSHQSALNLSSVLKKSVKKVVKAMEKKNDKVDKGTC